MNSALRLVSDSAPPGNGNGMGSGHGHAAKPGNGSERRPTLLLVEYEILTRLAAADFLRNRGYRVLEASTSGEALAVFAAGEPIELLFSDMDVPGNMNGAALAQWIRRQFPDVKILLTSAKSGTKDASGFYATFLRKPYAHESLLAQIRQLLMH